MVYLFVLFMKVINMLDVLWIVKDNFVMFEDFFDRVKMRCVNLCFVGKNVCFLEVNILVKELL